LRSFFIRENDPKINFGAALNIFSWKFLIFEKVPHYIVFYAILILRKQLVAAEFDRPSPFEYEYKVLKFVNNNC